MIKTGPKHIQELESEILRLRKARQSRWAKDSIRNNQMRENLRAWHSGAIGSKELHDFAARYLGEDLI